MIPKTIKLGGSTITIKHLSPDQIGDNEGLYLHEKSEIHVKSSMHQDRKEHILTHEILHAMTDFAGLRSTLPEDCEEDIVNRLAPVLHTFLKDNGIWFS